MEWHDQQDLANWRRRKRKQREYQQAYRERLKEEKTPDCDDIAAELMRAYLAVIAVDNRVAAEISRCLVDGPAAKGHDRQATKDRIRTMGLRVRARLKATGEWAPTE